MTWKAFHNRGEVLRTVIATAAERRDGILPMDLDGVTTTFNDECDLLGALQIKWMTRLSGHIERMQSHQPIDLNESVAIAWSNTAHELPGVRLILDHYRAHPTSELMEHVTTVCAEKERHLLAVMAGRTSMGEEQAQRFGAEIEERARLLHRGIPMISADVHYEEIEERKSFIDRLRAVIAA